MYTVYDPNVPHFFSQLCSIPFLWMCSIDLTSTLSFQGHVNSFPVVVVVLLHLCRLLLHRLLLLCYYK